MKAAVACLGVVLATPALAQDSGWSFALSPYAWTPGITSSVETAWGKIEVDKSIGDVLSDLDLAFMGAFEARNGRWGLIADLFYADLSESHATPLGALFSRVRIDTPSFPSFPSCSPRQCQQVMRWPLKRLPARHPPPPSP